MALEDSGGRSPLEVMPECFLNNEDVERLDYIIDKTAANSRWDNMQVAWAIARLLHMIVGDRGGSVRV